MDFYEQCVGSCSTSPKIKGILMKRTNSYRKHCTIDKLTPAEKQEYNSTLAEAAKYFDVPRKHIESDSKVQLYVTPRHCSIVALENIYGWRSSKLCVAFDINRRNLTSIHKKFMAGGHSESGRSLVHPVDYRNFMSRIKAIKRKRDKK